MKEGWWVSIITPTLNCGETIGDCIRAVQRQNYPWVEHLIVDGQSNDDTLMQVERAGFSGRLLVGRDSGIYAAINKGIALARGEVIGILHGDDYYANERVLGEVMRYFHGGMDAVLGGVWFVGRKSGQGIVRRYASPHWGLTHFRWGVQPPHPGFFLLRERYVALGLYRENYELAGDFEFLLRGMLRGRWRYHCVERPLVIMRQGGKSRLGWRSMWVLYFECQRACRENHFPVLPGQMLIRYFPKLLGVLQPKLGGMRRFLF